MTLEETNPYDLFSQPEPIVEKPTEYSVTELSNRLKNVVESNFSYVRVRGEFSRVTIAKSGHLYTSLKDDKSVLDAICWKGTLSKLSVKPEEGLEVICTGRLTTYPGRSNYQLIIESAEIAGQGALLKMLEERKQKLASEGLFDEANKKPLPFIPNRIGVITSPTGAVIRDIMHRLNERFPRHVLLYPVMVQGDTAAKTITDALNKFNSLPKDSKYRPDVLIIARGGGSFEDLMPFNDENLVRAVANCEIPIISAVGHETDTTLIDYAADLRAPTPTAAAEKAVPVKSELISYVMEKKNRLYLLIKQILERRKADISGISRGLISPKQVLENYTQKLDYLTLRLDASKTKIIENHFEKLKNLSSLLQSCSFERVLDRGYSVIFDEKNKIISSKDSIHDNQKIKLRLKDGEVKARIENK